MAGGWSVDSVGDFFDLVTGYAFKSSDFSDEGIPVIKIKNVKAGYFSKHQFSYVSQDFLDTRSDKIALADDLLISMSGNRHDGSPETWVGKVALFREKDTYLINQRVGALRLKRTAGLDARFASFLLSSNPFQELFISIATSSGGQANLSPKQILGAPVRHPEIVEQRAIAHILGTLDDKIELNRRMNETLEAMARALFKSWFVDFDPVRAKMTGRDPGLPKHLANLFPDRLVESEPGPIPQGWEVKTLSYFGDIVTGKTPSTKEAEYFGDDVPFLRIPDMHGKIYALQTQMMLSSHGASSQPKKTLPPGSVSISCIATPGLVVLNHRAIQTNQQINSIIPRNQSLSRYIYWSCRQLSYDIKIGGIGGSVFGNMNKSTFSSLPALDAEPAIIHAFDQLVSPMHDAILSNEIQSLVLAHVRDTLLPRLISGETRVRDADKQAGAIV